MFVCLRQAGFLEHKLIYLCERERERDYGRMGVIEGSELPHKRFEGISRAGWKYVGWLEMWDSSQESAPSLSLVIRGGSKSGGQALCEVSTS